QGTDTVCVFIVSTYTDGTPTESAAWFCKWLEETSTDFRVEKTLLHNLQYCVFGLGNSLYSDHYNVVGKNIDKSGYINLSALRVMPLGIEEDFRAWRKIFWRKAGPILIWREKTVDTPNTTFGEAKTIAAGNDLTVVNVQRKAEEEAAGNGGEKKEMVTPQLRKALTKQGYKIVGSHSGVKLCRWTKYLELVDKLQPPCLLDKIPTMMFLSPQCLRGRADITPILLVQNGDGKWMTQNLNIIRPPSTFNDKHIFTFMVTNAQFPDAIKNLSPVTQLYVSVDASTKDSLKKIDRPLFKDFWERFLESLKELSAKGQRTVYRLTLVKAFNTDEIENYAKLVSLGNPDFIEIKGVTYCGDSKASSLTMSNVPWHEEVVGFVKQIADELPDYEIASEHEHSNCILLAHKRFKIDEDWWTWIDYPKFHELVRNYKESNGKQTFSAKDYMAKTPHWAVFGAKEQGFDPKETRYFRKSKKDIGGC
ncbi:S-adenosyl-L-methionine-dependent tRNA 4-demethylwyosine synthase TYW1-like, partial [Ruditapes philippinarum]|uniref:S-adenosyl-L-methionine-dependent tRNA 4-demethylwyosine synthase TYW1-like n=1 Tax=Ruditapes philippinarum TaxID=129788 RepID=UPI00295B88BF